MSRPLFRMPPSITLGWNEYRRLVRALEGAEAELERFPDASVAGAAEVRSALELLLRRIWPELGNLYDGGTLDP